MSLYCKIAKVNTFKNSLPVVAYMSRSIHCNSIMLSSVETPSIRWGMSTFPDIIEWYADNKIYRLGKEYSGMLYYVYGNNGELEYYSPASYEL